MSRQHGESSAWKAIAEEIAVRFPSDPRTSDTEIARILALFEWDITLPGERIEVKVEKGWVTLTGHVPWHHQKAAAQKAAGKITGIKGLVNLLEVEMQPSQSDIGERILAAFKHSIIVEGGTVKLGGKIHGWNERQVAERAAWAAPGGPQSRTISS